MDVENKKIEEFQAMLEEKRHNETISYLTDILKKIPLINPDDFKGEPAVLDFSKIENMLSQMLSKKDESIPNAINVIGASILSKLESLREKKPTEWTFHIKRNNNSEIETVVAKSNNL